ncbi:hypothetical protein BDD12DRAFT_910247 [Trichophaea hybrida]|nr:hypothetical protein BDD12DRAFT_910247 [Trichophaea hybrida]
MHDDSIRMIIVETRAMSNSVNKIARPIKRLNRVELHIDNIKRLLEWDAQQPVRELKGEKHQLEKTDRALREENRVLKEEQERHTSKRPRVEQGGNKFKWVKLIYGHRYGGVVGGEWGVVGYSHIYFKIKEFKKLKEHVAAKMKELRAREEYVKNKYREVRYWKLNSKSPNRSTREVGLSSTRLADDMMRHGDPFHKRFHEEVCQLRKDIAGQYEVPLNTS